MAPAKRTLMISVALVLGLTASPTASASSIDVQDPGCGIVTDPACWAETFACRVVLNQSGTCITLHREPAWTSSCTNYGVVTVVSVTGNASYCADMDCRNRGVIIVVGASTNTCGNKGEVLNICVATLCTGDVGNELRA